MFHIPIHIKMGIKNLALALAASAIGANAEKWWLNKAKLPGPKTLEVVHFFTLYADQTPTISFAGPVSYHYFKIF